MSDQPKAKAWPWKDVFGDYSLVPIPDQELRSFASMFYVYMGVLACIAVLWGGATIGLQFTLKEAFWVAVAGSLILVAIGWLTSVIGGVSRCSTYVNMRFPFGMIGSQLFGSVVSGLASGIGWFAVQTWLFGIILHTLFPEAPWANVGVAAIWGGLLMITTAMIGFKGLAWLSYLAVPFFMLIAGVGVMIGLAEAEGFRGLAQIQPQQTAPFGMGVTMVVGMYISGGVITADISRYSRKAAGGAIAWIIQVVVFQVYMLVGAVALTLATGAANVAQALMVGGASVGAFLMAILGQWTTNDNNLYNGALSFNTWAHMKKSRITLIQGLIGTAIASVVGFSAGVSMDPFMNFLSLLGKVLPAIGGVLIADFYLYRWFLKVRFRERYQVTPGMKVALFNWVGWAAMILATVFGGWVIKSGIPALNALVLGAVFYIAIALICSATGVQVELGEHTINEKGV
jgi:cytosine permease